MEIRQKIKAYLLRLLTNKKNILFDVKKSKSVLILKYDRIGDMILSTPIFRELKTAYPDISISVLASKENRDVIKNNPYIDKIYTNYKNNIFNDLPTLLRLRQKKFDVCIELEHSVIPHAIFRLKIINPKKIISIHKEGRYGVRGSELKLYDYFTKKDKKSHFSKIWLDTLIFFGINTRVNKYDFFISDSERDRAVNFTQSMTKAIKIGINLEGSFKEKRIQKKQLEQICIGLYRNNNNIKIIIFSRPEKALIINKIISELQLDFVISSYKTNTINDAAALVEQLDLIITPDTSIVHIAGSFDKPVISIHEKNPDSFRLWSPISSLSRTVFSPREKGIIGFDVSKVIKFSNELIKEIS
jgi:ADP-heptose:LPS heptosyltransferase